MSTSHESVIAILALAVVVAGHPQCLDFTFPFTPKEPLIFCTEYASFGCCNRVLDYNIISEFIQNLFKLKPQEKGACFDSLKTLLCQKCSPYAAHIYDAENLPTARTFPGLCPSFCLNMLSQCPSLAKLLTNDTALSALIDQKNYFEFCKATTTIDPDYCYPSLKQNPTLSNDLGTVNYFKSESDCISICLEEIDSERLNPLSLKHARDGTHRKFVVEQLGIIWVYLPDNTRLEPPFLDLRNLVISSKWRVDERGLLDIEFHPDYKTNGKFYLYYSIALGGRDFTRISEMKVSNNDMNRANMSSERTLLEISQPAANHNGGQLLFKNDESDRSLFIFTGDGGLGGDPFGQFGNGQNKKTMLGKVLRIDVNPDDENGKPYRIPPDNPFVNDVRYLPEIYALGVRNMWRCSSDRGDSTGTNRGRIICGDVGQNRFEEIDIIKKGGNYGWRGYEGNFCYDRKLCNSAFIRNYVPPIHVYSHSIGKSVTGGYVYRGCQNPNLRGKYIFGDYQNGKMFALMEQPNNQWTSKPICTAKPEACIGKLKNSYSRYILSFGESEDGELYVLSSATSRPGSATGSIYKIVDPSRGSDPTECKQDIIKTVLSPGNRKVLNPLTLQGNGVTLRLSGAAGLTDRGRVEVYYQGRWGSICDEEWDIIDAIVVCRMLGFARPVGAFRGTTYGPGLGLVWLNKVACNGNENSIEECRHAGWGNIGNCGPFQVASVACA